MIRRPLFLFALLICGPYAFCQAKAPDNSCLSGNQSIQLADQFSYVNRGQGEFGTCSIFVASRLLEAARLRNAPFANSNQPLSESYLALKMMLKDGKRPLNYRNEILRGNNEIDFFDGAVLQESIDSAIKIGLVPAGRSSAEELAELRQIQLNFDESIRTNPDSLSKPFGELEKAKEPFEKRIEFNDYNFSELQTLSFEPEFESTTESKPGLHEILKSITESNKIREKLTNLSREYTHLMFAQKSLMDFRVYRDERLSAQGKAKAEIPKELMMFSVETMAGVLPTAEAELKLKKVIDLLCLPLKGSEYEKCENRFTDSFLVLRRSLRWAHYIRVNGTASRSLADILSTKEKIALDPKDSLHDSFQKWREECKQYGRPYVEDAIGNLCKKIPMAVSISTMIDFEIGRFKVGERKMSDFVTSFKDDSHALVMYGYEKDIKTGQAYLLLFNSWEGMTNLRLPIEEACLITNMVIVRGPKDIGYVPNNEIASKKVGI